MSSTLNSILQLTDLYYSTIFLFRENPRPILCPITHLLARAIRDNAVEVDGYNQAEPFFSTKLGRDAVIVHWKESMLKKPIFRKSVRTPDEGWVKSTTEPMRYPTYAFYLDRIGEGLGSEEKWTTYCLRRGNANALIGIGASNSIIDQVMRHDPMTGCLQNAYQNQRVGFNVQDAYLERDPSADGLTKVFTHMSIRCNADVPKEIPKAEMDKLPPDPNALQLKQTIRAMFCRLRMKYNFIKLAPKEEQDNYRELRNKLRAVEKSFKDGMTKAFQKAYRKQMYNEELENQLRGHIATDKIEPTVIHHLSERTKVQTILCDLRANLVDEELTKRKIQAIDAMVLLASRREVRPPRAPTPTDDNSHKNLPSTENLSTSATEDIPLVLEKRQCIYCVGNHLLPFRDRVRCFKRVSHMMDHVENLHLRYEMGNPRFICRHPKCQHLGDFLTSIAHFKNHVLEVHGVKLRA